MKVLSYCYGKPRNVSGIAAFLGLSNSTCLRSKVQENLESQNYLVKIRHGRTMLYKTNLECVQVS